MLINIRVNKLNLLCYQKTCYKISSLSKVKSVGYYLKHLGLLNKWPANCLFSIKTASLLTSSLIDLVYIHQHKKKTQESQSETVWQCGQPNKTENVCTRASQTALTQMPPLSFIIQQYT